MCLNKEVYSLSSYDILPGKVPTMVKNKMKKQVN